jgi:hypothetical protein
VSARENPAESQANQIKSDLLKLQRVRYSM